jgi:hypothetical protein
MQSVQLSAFFAAEHAEVWADGVAVPRHPMQPQPCWRSRPGSGQQGSLKPVEGPAKGGRKILASEYTAVLGKRRFPPSDHQWPLAVAVTLSGRRPHNNPLTLALRRH